MLEKVYKGIILFLLLFCFVQISFADLDYENNYTLIDCLEGNDTTGISFDSTMPYQTIKGGIEKTIDYINKNINKIGNEETASGKVFHIKINCTGINFLDGKINLDFYGNKYNNKLIIEGIGKNSFIIKNTYFYLPTDSGNINFINTDFEIGNKYNYYFFPQDNIVDFYLSGIKIINSNINLKNGYNLSYNNNFYYTLFYLNGRRLKTSIHYSYANQQLIYNSNIKIKLDNDYNFAMPVLLKDSKIYFNNTGTGNIYNIKFLSTNLESHGTKTNFSTFISNEIDLGGNNFSTINNQNFAFINNKIINFNNFIFGDNLEDKSKTIFINNFIDNLIELNISKSLNLFNNVFKNNFKDGYDILNHRKNYTIDNVGTKGISWFFKRNHKYDYFDLDFSSSSLYKEITGENIPKNNQEVYIIYE